MEGREEIESTQMRGTKRYPVHVEVCLNKSSCAENGEVEENLLQLFDSREMESVYYGKMNFEDHLFLSKNVNSIMLVDPETSHDIRSYAHIEPIFHIYHLSDEVGVESMEDEEDIPAFQQWVLPSEEYEGVWESLIFDNEIKTQLLDYAMTAMLFADKKVDKNIISCNRVVLLHGPPGTGKTSLCKALAQKLSIRFSDRYHTTLLMEINAHSLFSKWFSESGKLVLKLFGKIQELASDPDSLICILIDEVESLTAARKAALSGSEPSDAIRVVNAVLTQIDQLRSRDNVLILTTSNITGAIDVAFVDRADVKQFIGPPSLHARYEILRSCANELMRVAIISPHEHILDFKSIDLMKHAQNESTKNSRALLETALICENLSGRALRKLAFMAHAFFSKGKHTVPLPLFLDSLSRAASREVAVRSSLAHA